MFTDHGAQSLRLETIDPAMDHGVSSRACGVAGWAALSDRERTIARIVSQGMTNRQVARRVYLSPHTVNYHLRQIFKKLGINSRVQLAGLTLTHSQADR